MKMNFKNKLGRIKMKSNITLLVILTTFVALLVFSGCEKQEPFSAITPTEQETQNTTTDNGLEILVIGDPANSFSKVTTSSKWIDKSFGGLIKLNHYGDNHFHDHQRNTHH